MSIDRDKLIGNLVDDLKPVHRAGAITGSLLVWLVAAFGYSFAVILATGPFRDSAARRLIEYPGFAIETLIAALSVTALAYAALQTAIPGRRTPFGSAALPIVLCAAWVTVYLVGFVYPAHPVSMLGERDHCVLETVFYSVPNLLLLLVLARRLMPVWPVTTGALAGAGAAAVPGALMQFACMYDPFHNLTHHLGPIVLMAAIGAACGRFILIRRSAAPRARPGSLH